VAERALTLAYEVEGRPDAPVLVLSPALGTTTTIWDAVAPALSEHFRVVRHDHPGHGASPPPGGHVSIEDIGRGVLDVLDELAVARASFCGVSLGGMVGMWLGAYAPERIDRLVLACTGAKLGVREDYFARAQLVRDEGTAVVVDGARERWFTPAFRDTVEAKQLLDELADVPADGYAACCEAVASWDFRGELSRLGQPTLVVVGSDDPVTTPEVVETLVGGIAGARKVELPGAAHLANVERPEAFSAAVLAHLEERRPA